MDLHMFEIQGGEYEWIIARDIPDAIELCLEVHGDDLREEYEEIVGCCWRILPLDEVIHFTYDSDTLEPKLRTPHFTARIEGAVDRWIRTHGRGYVGGTMY